MLCKVLLVAELTPARSRGLLEAPERAANGRGRRWIFALCSGVVEFPLSQVWCMVQRREGCCFVAGVHGFKCQMAAAVEEFAGVCRRCQRLWVYGGHEECEECGRGLSEGWRSRSGG